MSSEGLSLMVQWLRLHASNAEGEGPSLQTELRHSTGCVPSVHHYCAVY